jgi:hypothetical protein
MRFSATAFVPGPDAFDAYIADVRRHVEHAFEVSPDGALLEFFGRPLDARSFDIVGLHHVGVYLGDYRHEEEIERWLELLSRAPDVERVRSGPSYIAPRFYGAPGYWIDCRLGGMNVELFSVKHVGAWAGCSQARKQARMSHAALLVDAAAHVEPLLHYFARRSGVTLLASSGDDELGHTYGHLLDAHTDRVLELVYSADARASGPE